MRGLSAKHSTRAKPIIMAAAKGSGRSGGGFCPDVNCPSVCLSVCGPKLTEMVPVGCVGGAGCRAAPMRQMTHTTLTVHATAITRRVDCAKSSDSNELLLLSTTEPLLPAGGTGPAVLMELIAAS